MFKTYSIIFSCLLVQGIVATSMAQTTVTSDTDELLLPEGTEVYETGVLKNISGYRGDVLGAEVISVVKSENGKSELIEVSIPLDSEQIDQVDRISVFSSSGQRIDFNEPLEITRDYDNNKIGINIPLSRKNKIGFVIRLIDLPEE